MTSAELDDPTLGARDTLLNLGTRSVLATPVLVFGDVIGVFSMHGRSRSSGRRVRSRWRRPLLVSSASPSTPLACCTRTLAASTNTLLFSRRLRS